MGSRICHKKYEFRIILIPYKKPVGRNMTFPIAIILTMQNVWAILFWQMTIGSKNVKHLCQ